MRRQIDVPGVAPVEHHAADDVPRGADDRDLGIAGQLVDRPALGAFDPDGLPDRISAGPEPAGRGVADDRHRRGRARLVRAEPASAQDRHAENREILRRHEGIARAGRGPAGAGRRRDGARSNEQRVAAGDRHLADPGIGAEDFRQLRDAPGFTARGCSPSTRRVSGTRDRSRRAPRSSAPASARRRRGRATRRPGRRRARSGAASRAAVPLRWPCSASVSDSRDAWSAGSSANTSVVAAATPEREQEHAGVEVQGDDAEQRRHRRRQRAEERGDAGAQRPRGQREPGAAGQHRDQQAFGQQLPHDAARGWRRARGGRRSRDAARWRARA